jgi:hypothetical protein
LTEKSIYSYLNHQIISKELTMRKFFMFAIVVLLIIGCSPKEKGTEQKLMESLTSEEKTDSILVPEQEPKVEKPTDLTEEKVEENVIVDEASLWSSYRSAKAAVKEAESNYEKQAKCLLEAAGYAKDLQRFDIEAWQYNNAGFVLIEGFKDKTDYINVMNKLNSLKLKSEITQYRKEARILLNKEKEMLSQAISYLAQAKQIDGNLEKSSRTTTIASNITFVNDVLNFLDVEDTE